MELVTVAQCKDTNVNSAIFGYFGISKNIIDEPILARSPEETTKDEFEKTSYEGFKPFLVSTPTKGKRKNEIIANIEDVIPPRIVSAPTEEEELAVNPKIDSEYTIYDDFIPVVISTPLKTSSPEGMLIKKAQCARKIIMEVSEQLEEYPTPTDTPSPINLLEVNNVKKISSIDPLPRYNPNDVDAELYANLQYLFALVNAPSVNPPVSYYPIYHI